MDRRLKRSLLLTTLAVGLLFVLATAAYAAPKPTGVTISQTAATIDLADDDTLQLTATVSPAAASQRVLWKSSNTKIATVSSTGLVRAKKAGKLYIYVRPYSNASKIARCALTVTDGDRPTSITVSETSLSLAVGETYALTATVLPAGSSQAVTWKSMNTAIASVTQDGVVRARKNGTTVVKVRSVANTSLIRSIPVKVSIKNAPTKVTITPDTKTLAVGNTLQLTGTLSPEGAAGTVTWASSDTSIATVTPNGLVTAKKTGTVRIAARSSVKPSIYTIRTLTINNPGAVTGVEIDQKSMYLAISDSTTLTATVYPSTAQTDLVWSSSNSSVVSVTDEGYVLAKAAGSAKITVKTVVKGFTDSITITVLNTSHATDVPERYTQLSEKTRNLAKIEAIKISAVNELASMVATREITSSEASDRKAVITRAFAMYYFPWMTKEKQYYWYTTKKYYIPNVIYYGMPYTQNNRRYNELKAISERRFVSSGDGYYFLNRDNLLNGSYVGNDCSSFASMSQWGMSHSASFLNTYAMYDSTYYKTITGSTKMRTGDILVKKGHTLMFLYYTNDARTQMMVIEQGGGSEPNTIACRLKAVSSYVGNGYIIRRKTTYSLS